MRIVIAVGGNALLQRGQSTEIEVQQANVHTACRAMAALAHEHELIITHGNGPQIGLLALQAAADVKIKPYPLDVLGAESQGMIGYLLVQALARELPQFSIGALLTQVEVAADDNAFKTPAKLIGPLYNKAQMQKLQAERGWQFAKDGFSWRRVVASPLPQKIVEIESIKKLLGANRIVICAGGGGIPVACNKQGHYHGVEAVIDKDMTSALLAESLNADRLLILTDVAAVMKNWGEVDAVPMRQIGVHDLQGLSFAEGSMAPKIKAACRFVNSSRRKAHIGHLSQAAALLQEEVGTTIHF